jgi:hypothetical protein
MFDDRVNLGKIDRYSCNSVISGQDLGSVGVDIRWTSSCDCIIRTSGKET